VSRTTTIFRIQRAVSEGKITPPQAMRLLELYDDIERARLKRSKYGRLLRWWSALKYFLAYCGIRCKDGPR